MFNHQLLCVFLPYSLLDTSSFPSICSFAFPLYLVSVLLLTYFQLREIIFWNVFCIYTHTWAHAHTLTHSLSNSHSLLLMLYISHSLQKNEVNDQVKSHSFWFFSRYNTGTPKHSQVWLPNQMNNKKIIIDPLDSSGKNKIYHLLQKGIGSFCSIYFWCL